jgi:hypothetical protein
MKTRLLLLAAIVIGLLIAFVDSRPSWDDTGVTAAAVFLACGLFSALRPQQPWIWALAVGVWIPLVGVAVTHNLGSLLAIAVAFVGAYGGAWLRHVGGVALE